MSEVLQQLEPTTTVTDAPPSPWRDSDYNSSVVWPVSVSGMDRLRRRVVTQSAVQPDQGELTEMVRHRFVETVKAFDSLRPNWDGDGALTIDAESRQRAIELTKILAKMPTDVFPTPRGTVQFEFDTDSESIEIEVFANSISYLKEFADGSIKQWSSSDFSALNDEVARLGSAP